MMWSLVGFTVHRKTENSTPNHTWSKEETNAEIMGCSDFRSKEYQIQSISRHHHHQSDHRITLKLCNNFLMKSLQILKRRKKIFLLKYMIDRKSREIEINRFF
ncbi:hypothetical protein NH340_JMT03165 [Sarcoptes scabiei]|nr:hypothetical protein NH340_JMT03165 [Sarcoptes scabiei]